jgi:hypothetical protein
MNRWLLLVGLALALPTGAARSDSADPAAGMVAPDSVVRGRFVQERTLVGFAAPLRTEGHFVLIPARGLIWQAETPFKVRTVITPTALSQRIGDDETTRLTADRIPALARLADMLTGALSGNWQSLLHDFKVERSGSNTAWQVTLTPRDAVDATTLPFDSISVRGGRLVDFIELHRPGGDSDRISFLDQTVGAAALDENEGRILDGQTK